MPSADDVSGCRAPVDASLPRLLTPRLHIEPLRPCDRDFHRDLYGSPDVMAQIGPPLSPAAAGAAFDAACRHNRDDAPGHRFWIVLSRISGEPLGVAALKRTGAVGEFGLMLRAGARDGRHAHEAVAAIVVHAFEQLAIGTLRVECRDNAMSRLVRRLVARHRFQSAPAPAGRVAWELDRSTWTSPH